MVLHYYHGNQWNGIYYYLFDTENNKLGDEFKQFENEFKQIAKIGQLENELPLVKKSGEEENKSNEERVLNLEKQFEDLKTSVNEKNDKLSNLNVESSNLN